jgi:hypothetical protein
MEHKMMKKLLSVGMAATVLGGASLAVAGYKWPYPLSIDPAPGGWVQGQLATVRNSSDASSYIGCSVDSYSWGGGVYCFAFDGATYKGCWHSDTRPDFAKKVMAVQALDGDGMLTFADAADGSCDTIIGHQASYWEPKQP